MEAQIPTKGRSAPLFFLLIFLFLILLNSGVSAQGNPLDKLYLERAALPDSDHPNKWITLTKTVELEEGDYKLYQVFASPETEMEISYIIIKDPDGSYFKNISNDVAIDKVMESGEHQISTFDTTAKTIELPDGSEIRTKIQKIPKDDPNILFDVARRIQMTAHLDGWTHIVYADSWVLLQTAGDPDEIITDMFTRAVGHSSQVVVTEEDLVDVTTTTTTIQDSTKASTTTTKRAITTSTTLSPSTERTTPAVPKEDNGGRNPLILLGAFILIIILAAGFWFLKGS